MLTFLLINLCDIRECASFTTLFSSRISSWVIVFFFVGALLFSCILLLYCYTFEVGAFFSSSSELLMSWSDRISIEGFTIGSQSSSSSSKSLEDMSDSVNDSSSESESCRSPMPSLNFPLKQSCLCKRLNLLCSSNYGNSFSSSSPSSLQKLSSDEDDILASCFFDWRLTLLIAGR